MASLLKIGELKELRPKKLKFCFRKSAGWKNFLSLTHPRSRLCIKIYIFNLKNNKQTTKKQESKKAKKTKEEKRIYLQKID